MEREEGKVKDKVNKVKERDKQIVFDKEELKSC